MRRDARSAETRERHERSFFYLCFVVRAVKHNTSICDAVRCVRARVLRLGRNASLTFFFARQSTETCHRVIPNAHFQGLSFAPNRAAATKANKTGGDDDFAGT